jgi:adenylate kinase family enzyme
MKRINEIRLQLPSEKIFIIGGVCSGKTTICNILKNSFGFKYLAIDEYRQKFGDGSLEGEKLAYQKFIQDVNSIESESPIVVECSGLSQYFDELETVRRFIFHLEVSEIESKFRQVQRELNGYKKVPFPYLFNEMTSFEDYMSKFPYTEFTYINSEFYNPEKIALSICDFLIRKKSVRKVETTHIPISSFANGEEIVEINP